MMRKVNYGIAGITFIGFLIVLSSFDSEMMQSFDRTIAHILFGNDIITAFHYIGDTGFVVSVATVLLTVLWIRQRNFRGMFLTLMTFGGGQVLNQLLKHWVKRPRPEMADQLGSFSFPSGHTMSGMLYLFTIAYFLTETMISKKNRIITWLITGVLVFFIGISRIAEGRHYATDVLGGWLISYTFFTLCIYWYERRKRIFEEVKKEHLAK